MSRVSWVTYARPFAKRIATYKKISKQKEERGIYWYAGIDYIECVKWTWHEFKAHILEGKP